MGWEIGFDHNWKRDIGYGVRAYCDQPGCNVVIDRGLGFVCGGEPYGGDEGCGLFFCGDHRRGSLCIRCTACEAPPFDAKPDHPDWIAHKATDPSWAEWRATQASELEKHE